MNMSEVGGQPSEYMKTWLACRVRMEASPLISCKGFLRCWICLHRVCCCWTGAFLRSFLTAHSNIFSVEKWGFQFQALQIIGAVKSVVAVVGGVLLLVFSAEAPTETARSVWIGVERIGWEIRVTEQSH